LILKLIWGVKSATGSKGLKIWMITGSKEFTQKVWETFLMYAQNILTKTVNRYFFQW
jgi:hypothetical protein